MGTASCDLGTPGAVEPMMMMISYLISVDKRTPVLQVYTNYPNALFAVLLTRLFALLEQIHICCRGVDKTVHQHIE